MSVHGDALKTQGEVVLKTIFLFQVVAGALGNIIILLQHLSILLAQKKRHTGVILTHLVLANLLIIILFLWDSPHNGSFVFEEPLNSLGCKFVCALQRGGSQLRPVLPCVLSLSVIRSPPGGGVGDAQRKGPRVTGPSCCLLGAQSLNEVSVFLVVFWVQRTQK